MYYRFLTFLVFLIFCLFVFISCVACCFKHFNHFLGGLHFIWWYFMIFLRKVLSKISRISSSKNALRNFLEFRIEVLLMNVSNCCVEFFSVLFWCWIIGITIKTSHFYNYVHSSLVRKRRKHITQQILSKIRLNKKFSWLVFSPILSLYRKIPVTKDIQIFDLSSRKSSAVCIFAVLCSVSVCCSN